MGEKYSTHGGGGTESVDHFWDKNLKYKDHLQSQEADDTDTNVNPEDTEPDLPEPDRA